MFILSLEGPCPLFAPSLNLGSLPSLDCPPPKPSQTKSLQLSRSTPLRGHGMFILTLEGPCPLSARNLQTSTHARELD